MFDDLVWRCAMTSAAHAPVPVVVPGPMAAFVTAGREALAECPHADGWDARTRRAAMADLDRIDAIVARMRAANVTAEQAAGTWALHGDRDLAGFLGRESRQGRRAGFAAVGQAATLTAMPVVADALVDGPVTATHVAEITRATAASPKLAAELVTPEGQARVVALAGRLDGAEFGRRLAALGAAVDPESRQRTHDEQRAARYLNISHTARGTLLKGRLDSVAGHAFAKVIDALNPRPAKDDERDAPQRRADALTALVARIASDRATTPGSVAPVQAIITIGQETWMALRRARLQSDAAAGDTRAASPGDDDAAAADAGAGDDGAAGGGGRGSARREPSRGATADVVKALQGVAPVLDETGAAWPASEIARALCDCALTRAVLDAKGQVLDLGSRERFFQRSHWTALLAAGQRTCGLSGCTIPLAYTEMHHMAWWDRDAGPTSLANCAPECAFHHAEIHRYDISVTRRPDGTYEHRWPDGRIYGGAPPGVQECDPPDDLMQLLTG